MSTFNFALHKCCLCGNLTDDGCFHRKVWYCLDCLDVLYELGQPTFISDENLPF